MDGFNKSGKKLAVVNLGNEISPYMKTLREFRTLLYYHTNVEGAAKIVEASTFPANPESENRIVIHDASLQIEKSKEKTSVNGPDHLMRLYAYNNVMRRMDRSLSDSVDENDALVDEAKAAHIVTPLSSLIVLESQRDYDRFDIHQSKNSLENASHSSSGAVPEPHEWALIFIAAATLIYYWRRNRNLAWLRSR